MSWFHNRHLRSPGVLAAVTAIGTALGGYFCLGQSPPKAVKESVARVTPEEPLTKLVSSGKRPTDSKPIRDPASSITVKAPVKPIERPETISKEPVVKLNYQPNLLIEAEALSKADNVAGVRVLDIRPWNTYESNHIPNSLWLDIDNWATTFAASRELLIWTPKFEALSVDLEKTIVIVDDGSALAASYLWWTMRYWGFKDVRVLNGGWPAYLYTGNRQASGKTELNHRIIALRPKTASLVTKNQFQELVRNGRNQVIEPRSSLDFGADGILTRPTSTPPSVKYLSWPQAVTGRQVQFQTPDAMFSVFQSAKIDLTAPTVINGSSPEETALLVFTLELLGAKNVRVYAPWLKGL